MSRYLMVDVGAGTMDVLYYDDGLGLRYKAVVQSPVSRLAQEVSGSGEDLVTTGTEMGGGALTHALRRRAGKARVVMSASSASTAHHSRERLASWGIQTADDAQAEALASENRMRHVVLGDLEFDRLERIVESFGVPFAFDAVGVCAQDHGRPPEGVSHLEYRHTLFKAALDRQPYPHCLLYRADEVPETLTRLSAIAAAARRLPSTDVYLMDSGMAAILGAGLDPRAGSVSRALVLDVATSHTVAAALEEGRIAGFFEYHTQDITLARLEQLLADLANGKISHRRLLAEGGHGAYVRKSIGFKKVDRIIATGPKRDLLADSRLPIAWGAPLGDNMMTGTAGVLEAVLRSNRIL